MSESKSLANQEESIYEAEYHAMVSTWMVLLSLRLRGLEDALSEHREDIYEAEDVG
jgi:hypothetical protein